MPPTFKGKVKYSIGASDIGDAKDFLWEYGVPGNDFWNDFDWKIGKAFLTCFSDPEIDDLTPKLDDSLARPDKIKLLRSLLAERLKSEDAALAPKSLLGKDVSRWRCLMTGICDTYRIEGNIVQERKHFEEIIAKTKPSSILTYHHYLASLMEATGQYAEAVETETPVVILLDEKLGPDSPQSLGGRRIIAKALWKMGKRDEAKELINQV